ncbi:hypothetical protein PanWU01x14_284360 [Parasponia andersonii]|uniref:Uncharacterized protein n=1 Tax=Parasponia andersonii TaxID=3476 RepID=A0A2P5B009_PARAD|nr:hypothetical protein PanWU01x14_284360 [Parasponia andersonii]
MGRRKNNSSSSSVNNDDMEPHHPTKIRFRDEDDEALDATTETSNLDESMCDVDGSVSGCDKAVDGVECDPADVSVADADDKTSADYYFDSYSHFGIHEVSLLYLDQSLFFPFL